MLKMPENDAYELQECDSHWRERKGGGEVCLRGKERKRKG